MIFGEAFTIPASTEPAGWIRSERRGEFGTVGGLVAGDHAAWLRVESPDVECDDWWAAYRDLFTLIASIGEMHTATPTQAWFAIWDGYGFGQGVTTIVWPDGVDRDVRRAAEREQREEDRRRAEAVRRGLAEVPWFSLTYRGYRLFGGPVAAVAAIEEPGQPGQWWRPDLMWPDDRRWFVATDVDFWSLYLGGDEAFIAEIEAHCPTPTERVTVDDPTPCED